MRKCHLLCTIPWRYWEEPCARKGPVNVFCCSWLKLKAMCLVYSLCRLTSVCLPPFHCLTILSFFPISLFSLYYGFGIFTPNNWELVTRNFMHCYQQHDSHDGACGCWSENRPADARLKQWGHKWTSKTTVCVCDAYLFIFFPPLLYVLLSFVFKAAGSLFSGEIQLVSAYFFDSNRTVVFIFRST